MDEEEKLAHHIELAERVASLTKDETTIRRFINFAEEVRQKLLGVLRRKKVRARAYELWEQAGCPPGRDQEFWLEAERQLKEEREH